MDTTQLQNRDAMLRRLARVEGQLRGLQKMIRDGSDCEKVAQQMTAARKALEKACAEMIACVLEHGIESACTDERRASDTVQQLRTLLHKYA
jgi:DNA-binding FrmR family transcriptional regulator